VSLAVRYPVPAGRARATIVIDRSRFICTLDRAASSDAAQRLIRGLRAEFADATHNCWAFVAGAPGSAAQIGMSDDGEPSGTAGKPMLTVLTHCGVGEIVAVVTRYYGGTKLGTGGLVKAYSEAVQAALAVLVTTERVDRTSLTLTVTYAHLSAVQHLLPQCEALLRREVFAELAELTVAVPAEREDELRRRLADATSGTAAVVLLGADA
jgi:uncharacterized YigZ family protein